MSFKTATANYSHSKINKKQKYFKTAVTKLKSFKTVATKIKSFK